LNPISYSLAEIAACIGAQLTVTLHTQITGIAGLSDAGPGQVSFYANPAYARELTATRATAVIIAPQHQERCPVPTLIMSNPYLGYAKVAALFAPPPTEYQGIHPTAWIDERAVLGKNVVIGPHAVIGQAVLGDGVIIGPGCVVESSVRIGAGSLLKAHVTVCRSSTIGQNALLHPGAVIGADGFGLANHDGAWVKIPQLGGVMIGDQVEIGANTTIDRGALGDTILANGVKLDNQIQIAHNVSIGEHTAIAGCVGIAGSTRVGKHCSIGGGVGIVGHITIADHVHITGGSVVLQSISQPGIYSSGAPLQPNRQWHRNYKHLKNLDEILKRLHAVETALAQKQEA